MVGSGRGAHAGVLIRNAEALEQLARVDILDAVPLGRERNRHRRLPLSTGERLMPPPRYHLP